MAKYELVVTSDNVLSSPLTLTVLDIVGPRGEAGPQGPQGPSGPAGATTLPGLTDVDTDSATTGQLLQADGDDTYSFVTVAGASNTLDDVTSNNNTTTNDISVGGVTATSLNTHTIPGGTGTLALSSDIPTVPTNNNQLTNGAGYITDYTVTQGDVTAHQAALSITESQISDHGTYATLVGGTVPASQLPSYVDDVEEYATYAGFPGTGEAGKIYVDLATGDIYRWSGSAYVQINDAVSSADQATRLATARTISLGGDVTGSASFDGTVDITITAAVADDSHDHTIANVDGLQTALDGKLASTSTTDNITEGSSNLYYTDTRANSAFDTRIATKDTDDLSEGSTNLYYTNARFDTQLATKDTGDLSEGSNQYYTDARVLTKINATSIDALTDVDTTTATPSDGQVLTWDNTNSYWKPSTVSGGGGGGSGDITSVVAGSGLTGGSSTGDATLNVGAGSFITVAADTVAVDATDANTASKVVARDASGNFSAGTITASLTGNVTGTVSDVSNHDTDDITEGSTNLYYTDARSNSAFDTRLATKSTSDLAEGTNLYYTNARADGRITNAVGTSVQAYSSVLDATTASYTTAEETKLSGIEANATADQTAAEIKTAYESNADTNSYNDAAVSKLSGIEANATQDQTGSEIKALYEAEADTNVFDDADVTKLAGIEALADVTDSANVDPLVDTHINQGTAGNDQVLSWDGSDYVWVDMTATMTDAAVKTAYENNSDTNVFDDAAVTKLSGIEALADVTDATNVAAAGAVMDADIGVNVQAYSTVLDATTASYTTAEETKLSGIEANATGDQTAAEIKTAYESNADTNNYDDAAVTKLAGIESNATGDQTGAEIKTALYAENDTNNYDDAAVTKLAGIEALADVTDTVNVTAAGAVMDSELTNEAAVKAINQGLTTTSDVNFNDLTLAGDLIVNGTTTTVNSTTVEIGDNIITLNSDETGTPSQPAGIEVERGTETNKTLVWDEATNKWTVGTETFVAATFEGNVTGDVTGTVSDISNFTTANLTENTNLYYTDTRANSAIDTRVDKTFIDNLNVDADTLDGNDSTAFATSAQGTKADSALQAAAIGVTVQAYSSVLAATTASYTTAEETKLSGIEANATQDQTGSEIATALFAETDTNNYDDAAVTKLAGIEALADVTDAVNVTAAGAVMDADVGVNVQAYSSVLDNTTASYTTAEETKLSGIETGATADMTGAEIKTAYELEANTNAYTDAEKTKLTGIESSAKDDQTGAEIKALYEAESDTNAFSDADVSKLSGIEANATQDQTAAEIKTAYESNADTNNYDDAAVTKLSGIEAGADVTDSANVDPLVDTHLNTSGATTDQVLAWNGTDYDWIDDPRKTVVSDVSSTPSAIASGSSGKTFRLQTGSGTININNANFAAGDTVSIVNNTSSDKTLTLDAWTAARIAGASANIASTSITLAAYGVATIVCTTSSEAYISGNVS